MSMNDDDAEILAVARAGFLDEAQEMLRQFEQGLLVLEEDPSDSESLNAAFRAAHTIKGTAGMFGCDAVVSFTHEAETLLEALRSGSRQLDEDVVAALLESRDQIELLLGEVQSGEEDPGVKASSEALAARLRALLGATAAAAHAPAATAPSQAPATGALGEPEDGGGDGCWHLSLRFGHEALRNGLDPLAFLRYLATLGETRALRCQTEAIPNLDELDAEACYLGFELRFDSKAKREDIERVFEFALEDSDVQIFEPGTAPAAFEELATRRCGEDPKARAALFQCWHEMGMRFKVRLEVAAVTAAETEAETPQAIPHIERRVGPAEEGKTQKRSDRRSGEGERREGGRDRRAGDETRFVRVRADKLDKLIDLIGELVIAGSGAQMMAHQEASPLLVEATQRVMDLVQETRDGTLALRMVPIGETFGRFQRVVRDVSKQLGKEVDLVVTGGDTELDKSMVDSIADPLMHLVRNSMDHGLETQEGRIAAGKPPMGRLALNAYHDAGAVVIEVSDDGRGLARERILAKAVERGLIAEGQVLPDHEVWQLIFHAGFSTAEQVTDLSGRGVGMDVVKRNIEALRGSIALSSEVGRGTLTQIRLPLTLAMIDGFLTMVGGVNYVLPLSAVAECIDVPAECAAQNERISGTFDLRGEVLPWLDLARFYGISPDTSRRRSVVVVRDGQTRVGLIVDRLMGEHQTVIKPLSAIFQHLKALAGSTILGSGDVALLLDVSGLLNAAIRNGQQIRQTGTAAFAHAVLKS
ncbi:two-component system chemotaxis sensor kinase CheA [Paucibacter oligotrophus]|uniref:Chemotaxis protein CheA n=1 Tax=Roseateles oligotrophus TaxID=1769250 RepID=A0A840L8B4_9BURK|nr:chemotaxis protein CheA [Roseateles oligotrophus]MBB4844804.1 two-component system chemotaxis sensor kinase CheA [Roseateles oligotrophus]